MGGADEFSWSAVLDLAVTGGGVVRVNPGHGLGFAPASALGRRVRQIGWWFILSQGLDHGPEPYVAIWFGVALSGYTIFTVWRFRPYDRFAPANAG